MNEATGVWIVQHDETPDSTVIGVFLTQEEAWAYSEATKDRFPNGTLFSFFEFGYRRFK